MLNNKEPHQFHRGNDGSECIRKVPGGPWSMLVGGTGSDAHKFMKVQNRFWKPWIKEAVERFHSVKRSKFVRRS